MEIPGSHNKMTFAAMLILQWVLYQYGAKLCTALIWFWTDTSDGFLQTRWAAFWYHIRHRNWSAEQVSACQEGLLH